ncbi:hypothetical protein [Brevibacterium sp. Mu109]|uniref:hypothetical protein n=1 Tax=Brevibacterium sp. Mu109 TaxID=1255669 RepID=UPI000C76B912|nr:hypothetical protein [Brevibacterium sp. Mu109]
MRSSQALTAFDGLEGDEDRAGVPATLLGALDCPLSAAEAQIQATAVASARVLDEDGEGAATLGEVICVGYDGH